MRYFLHLAMLLLLLIMNSPNAVYAHHSIPNDLSRIGNSNCSVSEGVDCFLYEAYLHRVGSLDLENICYDLESYNGLIGIADFREQFQLVSIQNPYSPEILSSIAFDHDVVSVELGNQYAYVFVRYEGLYIVDIGNPSSPQVVSSGYSAKLRGSYS